MKMRIATMVTGHFTCPPPKGIIYAPMFIAEETAKGLKKLGHKVDFFAPKNSKIKNLKIISDNLNPLFEGGNNKNSILKDPLVRESESAKIANLWDQYLISLIYQKALKGEYDLIHVHPADRALPFGMAINRIPVVYTLHDPIYPWRAKIFRMFQTKNQYYVSISNAQRKPAPDLNWIDTVYNGIDLNMFPFSAKPKNHCLFVGRIIKNKGPDQAIEAAKKAKEELLIAGTPNHGDYWENKIKPQIKKNIKYIGNIPYKETFKIYGEAKAALFPIQWEEPFGLTFIEAMACGTPVITFDRGSAREVVKDGKTGFIVRNSDEMAKAIKKIGKIDRRECRRWVEKNFSIKKMAENYEKAFLKILQ